MLVETKRKPGTWMGFPILRQAHMLLEMRRPLPGLLLIPHSYLSGSKPLAENLGNRTEMRLACEAPGLQGAAGQASMQRARGTFWRYSGH